VLPLRDENPTSRTAYVTIALIVINLAIYFFIQIPKGSGTVEETQFTYEYAAVPCELDTGRPIVVVPVGDAVPSRDASCFLPGRGDFVPQPVAPGKNVWLAVVYSMFLHGSVLHVLGNMLFLWIFGNNVEDQLGPVAFLAFYLVGGIVASGVHIAVNLDSTVPIVGASGAIAAVMGAYLVWFPHARILTVLVPLIFIVLRLPAVIVLGFWFVMQFLTQNSSGIATLAHIGGFVFGVLVALLLRPVGFPRAHVRPAGTYREYDDDVGRGY
jgi:membrane associated rhomboid family serine protease